MRASRAASAATLLAACGLIVVAFWALSQSIVATWLERDAVQRAGLWATDQTPWRWTFAESDAVVVAGSDNVQILARDADGLRVRVSPPAGALSLAMRGEGIDPSLVGSVELAASTAVRDVRAVLLAQRGTQFSAWTSADLAASAPPRLALTDIGTARVDGLQLRIETAADTDITLQALRLRPTQRREPALCAVRRSIDATLQACDARLARFTAPPMVTTDQLLWWRDALLAQRPAAVVTAALGGFSLAGLLPDNPVKAAPTLLLMAGALAFLAALALRRRRHALTKKRAALELALVIALPVCLLAGGWPGDDVPWPISLVFGLSLATAFALRDPDPDWHLLGDARARRTSAWFTLIAGGALLACGLALASSEETRMLQTDRFWRYPLWAALQQWLLIRTIAPRTRRLTQSKPLAAVFAGALFALLHLPNFGLMLATFLGGSVWAWLGYRHRALLPLVVSHALLGLLLVGNLPPWLLRSAEVGGRYLMSP